MDRIEVIKKLQESSFKIEKNQSMVLNNFYSIITIGTVCLSIIFYVVYILPAQEVKKQRELKAKQHQEYLEKRAKEIALSHKLNNINLQENNHAK